MSALQPFGPRSSDQVVPFEQCEPVITDTYQRFHEGKMVSREEFDLTCLALETLEKVEAAFQNSHLGENSEQHERLVTLRAHVDEMHGATQQLVRRDGDLLRAFFQRPENKYFRTANGEIYIQPDDGGLVPLCHEHLFFDRYKGFQFSRNMMLQMPRTGERRPSTVLFFEKFRDQISFEGQDRSDQLPNSSQPSTTDSTESPLSCGWLNPNGWYGAAKRRLYALYNCQQIKFDRRSEQQKADLFGLVGAIAASLEQRGYHSMSALLNKEDRGKCGLSGSAQTDVDVIVLWYKKLGESSNVRVEEVFDPQPGLPAALPETEQPTERSPRPDPAKTRKESPMNSFWSVVQRIASVVRNIFRAARRLGNWMVSKFSATLVSTTN